MKDMSKDFEDMVKAREAAKKELQARFDECHDLLDKDRAFAEEQAAIMEKFKTDYTEDLLALANDLETTIKDETDFMTKELDLATTRVS